MNKRSLATDILILVALASALTLMACSVEESPSPVTTLPASPRPEAKPTTLAPTPAAPALTATTEPSSDSGYGQAEFRLVHRIIPGCILGLRDGPRHLAFSHSTKLGSHDWGIYELKTDDLDIWSYTTWVEGWKDTPFIFDLRFPLHAADDVRQACQADAEAVLATSRPAETPTPTPLPVVDAYGTVTLALSAALQAATPFQVRYAADSWNLATYDVLIEPGDGSGCSLWLAPALDRSASAPVSEEIELGGYVWVVRILPDPTNGGIMVYETRLDGDRLYRFHLYLAYTESAQLVADCRSRAEAVITTFEPKD